MSIITVRESDHGAAAKPEPPAPVQEIKALLKRAENGDQSCLPEIRALLADGEGGDRLKGCRLVLGTLTPVAHAPGSPSNLASRERERLEFGPARECSTASNRGVKRRAGGRGERRGRPA